jgi:hypothetical protein
MLPTSSKRRISFTPPWREEEENKPIYTLRVPTIEDRAQFNSELADRKAYFVTRGQFCAEARRAVEAMDPPNKDDLLALLERISSVPDNETIPEADGEQMAALEDVLTDQWPAYKRMASAAGRWTQFMPVLAARMFLVGWKNGPDGKDRIGTLSDEDRMLIPNAELISIGWKAVSLMTVTAEQKNG